METTSRPRSVSCDDAIVHRILTAVAETEQCDVLDLAPLSAVVDPDALSRVAQGRGVTGIAFPYHGYRVSIDGDGHVDVTPGQE